MMVQTLKQQKQVSLGVLEDVEQEKGFIADRLNVGEGPKGLDFVMEPPKPILPTD